MTFILGNERDADVVNAFAKYKTYLVENKSRFPPAAYDLAISDWFYNFGDHRCPHDAWLENIEIKEASNREQLDLRQVEIKIKLLGAYHDGFIEFHYPKVYRYQLDVPVGERGHGDWRYDEFRLSKDGHVIHEIEWRQYTNSSRWVIESSDVTYKWEPR